LGQGGRVGLWEWVIDRDQMRLEKEARVAIERYQEVASLRLVKRLQELPPRAFGEFAQLLLEAQDFSQFRAVKRPTGNPSEQYMAAVQRTLTGDLSVALTVRRDGRDVGREQVVELRGSLHYYGSVALGLIVTAGQVMSGAREEAQVSGATPVHFIDGARLARLCEQTGVGVVRHELNVSLPDVDMFEALRAT
jgi:restriction endonuclease Mrr